MKKLTYLLAALILAVGVFTQANAQEINTTVNDLQLLDNLYGKVQIDESYDSKHEGTQAVQFGTIRLCIQSSIFSLYSKSQPIAYDPTSNLILLAGIKFNYNADGLFKIIGEVYSKTPQGMTWDSLKVFNEDEMGLSMPSVAVHNTNSASSIDDLSLTMTGRFFPKYADWMTAGIAYAFKTGSDIVPDLSEYPDENNPGNQYSWGLMKSKSSGQHASAYSAGVLSTPMETQVQYGAYGFLATDNDAQGPVYSSLPAEWDIDLFRSPPQLSSSYNSPMEIAVDNDDNVYVVVNNIFNDDEENRVPAVSYSNDNGGSWSDFSRMPPTLMDEYVAATEYEFGGAYDVYNQMNGLVAYNGGCSYFYPFFLAANDTIREIHIVEAKYTVNGNAWSFSKVAELNGFTPRIFYRSDIYPDADDKFRITDASLGYEIQASKTENEDYIIVKWIDQGLNNDGTGKVIDFAQPVGVTVLDGNNQEQDAQLNMLSVMDIFFARKPMDNSKPWHVMNGTNDSTSYKATWIPDIVPAVDNIPIVWAPTAVYSDPNNAFNRLPQVMRDRIVEFAFSYAVGNFTEPMSVEETTNDYDFAVLSVNPNPVTDMAEFTFTLEEAANVRVEIYNSLGQLVRVVFDNYASVGTQAFSTDLSDLSNGVYYYTLTSGNHKVSKVLNIVK